MKVNELTLSKDIEKIHGNLLKLINARAPHLGAKDPDLIECASNLHTEALFLRTLYDSQYDDVEVS